MRKIDDLELTLQVESYIIGKIFLAEKYKGLSSRVCADEIIKIVQNYLEGKPSSEKKPWEHFSVGGIEMCV
jgi:hypothetical protein